MTAIVALTVRFEDDTLVEEFLQLVRRFDGQHSDKVHMNIGVATPGMSIEEIEAVLDGMDPPYDLRSISRKQ
jgi:hypothetical protein